MHRKALAAVAAGLLVVVAGCAGFGASGTETPNPTAEPTPTRTETPTSTGSGSGVESYPAGWSETGVDDVNTAFKSHYRAMLSGPAVAVTYRSRVVSTTNERARNTTLDLRVDTGSKRVFASIDGKDAHREVFFANGTLSLWSVQNETMVDRSNGEFVRVAQSIDNRVLKSQLLLYELEFNRTTQRHGTTALVYDVVGVHNNSVSGTYGAGRSGSGQVVVSEAGRVLEIETTVTYTDGMVRYRYTHGPMEESAIDTPEWARAA